jgi:hypothetical protein
VRSNGGALRSARAEFEKPHQLSWQRKSVADLIVILNDYWMVSRTTAALLLLSDSHLLDGKPILAAAASSL